MEKNDYSGFDQHDISEKLELKFHSHKELCDKV